MSDRAILLGEVINLGEGDISIKQNEHEYQPPCDQDRLGEHLEQRRVSYIEASLTGKPCRLLSLSAVAKKSGEIKNWNQVKKGWSIQINNGLFKVELSEKRLNVMNVDHETNLFVNLVS